MGFLCVCVDLLLGVYADLGCCRGWFVGLMRALVYVGSFLFVYLFLGLWCCLTCGGLYSLDL